MVLHVSLLRCVLPISSRSRVVHIRQGVHHVFQRRVRLHSHPPPCKDPFSPRCSCRFHVDYMAVSTLKEGLSSDENDFSSVEDDTSSDEVNADATNLNTAYVSLPPVVLYPSIMDYSVLALQQHCQKSKWYIRGKIFSSYHSCSSNVKRSHSPSLSFPRQASAGSSCPAHTTRTASASRSPCKRWPIACRH